MRLFFGCFCCRSLCGFVDWNHHREKPYEKLYKSKPLRLRGLKSQYIDTDKPTFLVEAFAASWIEMSYVFGRWDRRITSKPLRLRGLKSIIEYYAQKLARSKPLRLRGLKWRRCCVSGRQSNVEAFAASWIEIQPWLRDSKSRRVEAFAASWIEIGNTRLTIGSNCSRSLCGFVDWNWKWFQIYFWKYWSKPLRLRGLKYLRQWQDLSIYRRSLCGFVDWNLYKIINLFCRNQSKPLRLRGLKYSPTRLAAQLMSRSLCGFVDWNLKKSQERNLGIQSKPLRLRGLKSYGYTIEDIWVDSRSLCGFVDWNNIWKIYRRIMRKSKPLRLRGLK